MLDCSCFRLWAVVDVEAHSVVFSCFSYSLAQSFRDRLWDSWRQFYLDVKDDTNLRNEDWKKQFQLIRFDLNRNYVPVTPLRAAGAAFVESLRGS